MRLARCVAFICNPHCQPACGWLKCVLSLHQQITELKALFRFRRFSAHGLGPTSEPLPGAGRAPATVASALGLGGVLLVCAAGVSAADDGPSGSAKPASEQPFVYIGDAPPGAAGLPPPVTKAGAGSLAQAMATLVPDSLQVVVSPGVRRQLATLQVRWNAGADWQRQLAAALAGKGVNARIDTAGRRIDFWLITEAEPARPPEAAPRSIPLRRVSVIGAPVQRPIRQPGTDRTLSDALRTLVPPEYTVRSAACVPQQAITEWAAGPDWLRVMDDVVRRFDGMTAVVDVPAREVRVLRRPSIDPEATRDWHVFRSDGSLRKALERWAAPACVQIVWDAPQTVAVNADAVFRGNLWQALEQLSKTLAQADTPLAIVAYRNNVVRVMLANAR
jgi:hypothetical protein